MLQASVVTFSFTNNNNTTTLHTKPQHENKQTKKTKLIVIQPKFSYKGDCWAFQQLSEIHHENSHGLLEPKASVYARIELVVIKIQNTHHYLTKNYNL